MAAVDERSRVLVVQRTGWGKSLVYFLATRILRDRGSGPTLLVSPLLSLMRDQLLMAGRLGVRARTINSANVEEWDEIDRALRANDVDLLLVSPERLGNERFRARTLGLADSVGLFVVDEAHCISDWGHDFRPDYRRIGRLIQQLPPGVPLLATTATANNRVIADIGEQLGEDLVSIRGPLTRESLRLQVIELADQARAPRLARPEPADVRRLRDRLLPHGGGLRARRRVARRPRYRCRPVLRPTRRGAAAGARGSASPERGQGARGHRRTRDGLRQAGPRVRRALPAATVGHRVLPADRAGGPRARRRRGRPPPRPRGRRDRQPLHRDRISERGRPSLRLARDRARRRRHESRACRTDQLVRGPDREVPQSPRARRGGLQGRTLLLPLAESVGARPRANRERDPPTTGRARAHPCVHSHR